MKFNTQEEHDAYVEDLETALMSSRSPRAPTIMSNAALRAELVAERNLREKAETELEVARSQRDDLVKRAEQTEADLLGVTEALRLKIKHYDWVLGMGKRAQAELESAQADAETQREKASRLEQDIELCTKLLRSAGDEIDRLSGLLEEQASEKRYWQGLLRACLDEIRKEGATG